MRSLTLAVIAFANFALAVQTPLHAADVGSAFTYQGQLSVNGERANGAFDLYFRLMSTAGGGFPDVQVGDPVVFNDVTLVDGLFTGQLDFGDDAINGDARWLEISIRPGSGFIYTVLSPRQRLTPAPLAIGLALPYAASKSSNGVLFNLHQQGTGGAGSITVTNPDGGNALYLQSNSDAAALYSFATGVGEAGEFVIYNAASTAKALVGQTIGFGTAVFGNSSKGKAGWFQINTAANASDALLAETSGTGDAVQAHNSSPSAGRAGWFRITNAGNPTEAFRADTVGTGSAGYFRITNSNSASDALRAETNGSGSALYGANTGSGAALELGPGAIRVVGAGVNTATSVFIHTVTDANRYANYTTIDHPHSNDNPNAILIVTPNNSPPGLSGWSNSHPVGVSYLNSRWVIYNVDSASLDAGVAFNVMVVRP